MGLGWPWWELPAGHPAQLLLPQKAAPALLRQSTSVPSPLPWVPGAGAQCRAVSAQEQGHGGGSHGSSAITAASCYQQYCGCRKGAAPSGAPWQIPDALGHVLASLCCSRTSQRTASRNPDKVGTWQHILSPKGLAVHPGRDPRWLQVLIPCPVHMRLVHTGGFQELVLCCFSMQGVFWGGFDLVPA